MSVKKNIISVQNLSLQFEKKIVLSNITFNIKKGKNLVLLGKNGSGKTVLLKSTIGIYKANQGRITLFDKDITNAKENDLIEIRRKTGYVFQKSGLFDSLTISENVLFALKRFKKKNEQVDLEQVAIGFLESTGLKDVDTKYPAELSGGMQKRAGIARAIATDPELLLLDDPTAGLDPVLTDAIGELILNISRRKERSALIVTHDLKLAYKVADEIALMHEGKILLQMSAEEFKNSEDPYVKQYTTRNLIGPIDVL